MSNTDVTSMERLSSSENLKQTTFSDRVFYTQKSGGFRLILIFWVYSIWASEIDGVTTRAVLADRENTRTDNASSGISTAGHACMRFIKISKTAPTK